MFSLIGLIIGGVFGGPIGAAIGGAIGGIVDRANAGDPPKPDIEDHLYSSSAEGQTLPIVYGRMRVPAQVVWSPGKDVKLEDIEQDAFFGLVSETVGYRKHTFQSATCIFCEGPIIAFEKVYANGKIVYDMSSTASDDVKARSLDFKQRYMNFHLGTDGEERDSVLLARAKSDLSRKGGLSDEDDVPHYSRVASIVFNQLYLNEYGNGNFPNINATIITSGTFVPREWERISDQSGSNIFPARSLHGIALVPDVSGKETLYVMAGWFGDNSFLLDLWATSDGVTWTQKESIDGAAGDNIGLGSDHYWGYGRFGFTPIVVYIEDGFGITGLGGGRELEGGWYIFLYGGDTLSPGGTSTDVVDLYYYGGDDEGNEFRIVGFMYNVASGRWSPVPHIYDAADTIQDETKPWPRSRYSACRWKNKIWVAGGVPGSWLGSTYISNNADPGGNRLGDLYYSDDGYHFVQIDGATGSYLYRDTAPMVNHQGDMYILGGKATQQNGQCHMSNACYKFIGGTGGGSFTRTAIDVTAYTLSIKETDIDNAIVVLDGDQTSKLAGKSSFAIYHHPTGSASPESDVWYFDIFSYSLTSEGDTEVVKSGSGFLPAYNDPNYTDDLTSESYFWVSMFTDISAAPNASHIHGACSFDGYLVAAVQVSGFNTHFVRSEDGITWETYELAGATSVPEYDISDDPYFGFVNFMQRMYIIGGERSGSPVNTVWRTTYPSVSSLNLTLQSAVEYYMQKAGYESSQYDASDLSTETINGMAKNLNGLQTTWQFFDQLGTAYLFDYAEVGNQIIFTLRGSSSEFSITANELGVHEDGEESPDSLIINKTHERDLPEKVIVNYRDPVREHLAGSQYAKRIGTQTTSNRVITVDLPISLTASEAAKIANVLLWASWNESFTYEMQVGIDRIGIYPTKVFDVTDDDGINHVLRCVKSEYAYPGIVKLTAKLDDPSLYADEFAGIQGSGETGNEQAEIKLPDVDLLDIPAIASTHDKLGFYVAACPEDGNIDGYQGFDLYLREPEDDQNKFTKVAYSGRTTVKGTVDEEIGEGSYVVLDRTNTIKVTLDYGELNQDKTRIQVLKGQNWGLFGNEIIGFHNVEYQGEDSNGKKQYHLTNLLRGLLGTELKISDHSAGETFILLDPKRMTRINGFPERLLNDSIQYKYIIPVQNEYESQTYSFTNSGKSKKPLPITQIKFKRMPNGDFLFEWKPRGTKYDDLSHVEYNTPESVDSYVLEFANVYSGTNYIIEIESNRNPFYLMTVEEQIDFFGSEAFIADFFMRIYQRSYDWGYSEVPRDDIDATLVNLIVSYPTEFIHINPYSGIY